MGKKEERCALRNDLRGCALKHIGAARKLISKGEIKDADAICVVTLAATVI